VPRGDLQEGEAGQSTSHGRRIDAKRCALIGRRVLNATIAVVLLPTAADPRWRLGAGDCWAERDRDRNPVALRPWPPWHLGRRRRRLTPGPGEFIGRDRRNCSRPPGDALAWSGQPEVIEIIGRSLEQVLDVRRPR